MSKYYSSSIAFGANQTKTEQVVVSPTKIGDVTTDAVSGALTVDEVPTLDSLNPVSSDGVARAVIQAGAELPTRSSSDTGKVLTVKNSDGDLEWDEPAEELPDMAGKDGKLLGAVDNNGTMEAQWVNAPDSYPSVSGNAGKVLAVNSGATGVEWISQPTVPTTDQTYNSASTNPQSGTAVAGAIAAVNQLPASTSADENKVLTVNAQGAAGWANPPTELPTVTGNANKVLAVNSGATGVEWVTAQGGSSDVFIIEDSTTLGDVYTAYTSGKVLIYKASTGDMYYVSSDGTGVTYNMLNLYGTYTMPYLDTRLYVKAIYVGIAVNNGQPTSPTNTFGQSILDFAITTSIPLPNIGSGDVGKILQVTSNGLAWVNNVPIEVVSSMPASPTAGVLYIVTGA